MKTEPAIAAVEDPNDEISALVTRLIETEQRLLELTQGQVDGVLDPGGRSYLLRQAQERLLKSEAVQRKLADTQVTILDALPANIALIDSQGVIISVNEGWRRFAGINALQDSSSGVGQNYLAICESVQDDHSNESHAVAAGIRSVLTGKVKKFELEYPCHSPREQKWFRLLVTPLHESSLGGAVVMHLNVTERKLAENELQLKTAFLEAQLDSSIDGVLVVDAHGKKVLQNQRVAELFKIPQAILDDPDDQKQVLWVTGMVKNPEQFAERTAHFYAHPDEISREETELKDGTVLDRYSAPVIGRDGKNYGRIWSFRDITERKRAAEAAIRMAAIVESSNDAIFSTDLNGIITHWNKSAEKIYGYQSDEIIGTSILRLIPAERHDEEWHILERLTRNEYVQNFETMRLNRDGKLINVSVTASPIKNAAGQIIGVSKVVRDITEHRKLEAQLRQSQKMEAIGQLAGGVAHDFNNILAVIQMQVGLLKLDGELSPTQLAYAEDIEKSSHRAADLTRQLLMFARRQMMQPRDLDLNTVVENMTKMLRRILGEDIRMQFKYAAQALSIHADAGMMDQILMNLAVNSRDAMPKGGLLIIETSAVEFDELAAMKLPNARAGSFVCLNVSDTGVGIPPEALPRIFEPFFTTKDVGKGTGLGLATVFGIVQQHHGWIHVYSEVGKGTAFKIYLPRLGKMVAQSAAQPLTTTLLGGNETILLVEDDPALRAAVRTILSQLGYRILQAHTGASALEIWKEHRAEIRLLLTDMVMPDGMNGKELAQQLLQESPELKVIYTSGYSAEVAGKDLPLQDGVNFLTKPFETHKLAKTVRDCLNLKKN